MNSRSVDLVAAGERERWPLAGDQLFDLETISAETEAGRWQFEILQCLLEDASPRCEDQPAFEGPFGVRYWHEEILLLERDAPVDPALHRDVWQRLEELRQAMQATP